MGKLFSGNHATNRQPRRFLRMQEQVVILDFGSQYTQVIARRIREAKVFSTILPYHTPAAEIAALNPKGIILSGGPSSVYARKAPKPPDAFGRIGDDTTRAQTCADRFAGRMGCHGSVPKAGRRAASS